LTEYVEAMKLMWTEKTPEFHGKYVDFEPVWVEPKRTPHPPIYIGASSKWAIARVAELGDGWLPNIGSCDLDERMAQLRRLCDELGRDASEIDDSVFAAPADKAALETLAKQGVHRIITMLPSKPESDVLRILEHQAELVEWARDLE
jgi:alkanesulfonate monooxygenase SsuD/methylene tetrahydromethanopterin reductase-like flavin-dependent oxidoreductase (luciferase family)